MTMSPFFHYRRTAGWLGANFVYLARTTSTHDVLCFLAENGAQEGWVVLADEQTAGRGRLGRRWAAPPASCLLFSLLFRPPAPFVETASRAPMMCGIALVETILEVTGLHMLLKWPNDGIVERESGWGKVAGMLSETGFAGATPAFLMVGIGLNVNVPKQDLVNLDPLAASLQSELGHSVERVQLMDEFLARLEVLYEQFRAGWDPWAKWKSHLAWLGREIVIETPTGPVSGIATDVDTDGALLLTGADGSLRRFPVGDVSLRLQPV
ncbi:MAG: biotin--[acetyl-CoA-carboxylase] ligase [Anaerolineae bacterium]|nr:biotin--[acetyl-CoA-carboxylase] ligase [Anaerolineae bacterium]